MRQGHDVRGDGHPGIHKRAESVDNLAATQAGGCDLGELARGEREARRLRVENDHVVLEQAKVLSLGTPRQASIGLHGALGRSRQQYVL